MEQPTTLRDQLLKIEEGICETIKKNQPDACGGAYGRGLLTDAEVHANMRELVAKLGSRYALATLREFDVYDEKQEVVIAQLTAFSERIPYRCEKGGLMLFGKPGTGKDHLLAALLKIAVVKHRLSVDWWDGLKLAARFRHLMNEGHESEDGFIGRLVKPHILALSDPVPPKGELTQYQLSTLRDVIDRRYRQGKVIWITTNVDNRNVAEELLSWPVMDRLKEGALQIYCDWPSYRERVGKKPEA